MTAPIDPIRPPLVEPALPARPVARRRDEQHDEQSSRRRREEEEPRREDDGDEDPGLHVDVLA
jgi:hypothetical protein